MDTRRSRGRDPRGEDWGWGAEREVERGKRKKGREKSKERKTRVWEAREMVGRGRKEGRREAGKHGRRGVWGGGYTHGSWEERQRDRGSGTPAQTAWGDRDGEKELGGKRYKERSVSREGRRAEGEADGFT